MKISTEKRNFKKFIAKKYKKDRASRDLNTQLLVYKTILNFRFDIPTHTNEILEI